MKNKYYLLTLLLFCSSVLMAKWASPLTGVANGQSARQSKSSSIKKANSPPPLLEIAVPQSQLQFSKSDHEQMESLDRIEFLLVNRESRIDSTKLQSTSNKPFVDEKISEFRPSKSISEVQLSWIHKQNVFNLFENRWQTMQYDQFFYSELSRSSRMLLGIRDDAGLVREQTMNIFGLEWGRELIFRDIEKKAILPYVGFGVAGALALANEVGNLDSFSLFCLGVDLRVGLKYLFENGFEWIGGYETRIGMNNSILTGSGFKIGIGKTL